MLGDQRAKAYEGVSRIPVESASFEHRFVPQADGIEIRFLLVQPSEKRVICRADGKAIIFQLPLTLLARFTYRRDSARPNRPG